MRILIIEDEKLTAEALEQMILDLRPGVEILDKIPSVEESVEWLETHSEPDLIFCDIHLSDGNSFEIFKEVDVHCPVIFSTAYNQYAIEAFQVNSIDYLLKPLDKKEVARALKKYEAIYRERNSLQIANLQKLIKTTTEEGEQPPFKSRFMAKIGDVMKSIPSGDIAYFHVEDGEVVLRTFDGKRYFPHHSLDQLQEQLDPAQFFRANRQIIVNIAAVRELKPYFKGRLVLYVDPPVEEQLVISSEKAKEFKEWLEM